MLAHNQLNVTAGIENDVICTQNSCMNCSRLTKDQILKHLHSLAYTMVDRRDTERKQRQLMKSIAVSGILDAGSTVDMLSVTGLSKSIIPPQHHYQPIEPKETHIYANWRNRFKELATASDNASVFGKLGILAVKSDSHTLKIPKMNALAVPAAFLAQYGAELIPLTQPVDIEPAAHDSLSNLYLVEYHFDEQYIQDYALKIEGGGGIFIETHPFPQIFIPLSPTCSGGLILGRKNSLYSFSFVAIEIPFGFSLKIKSNVIHGDAFFVGPYAIALTETELADSVLFRQDNPNRDILKICQKPVKPPRMPLTSEHELFRSAMINLLLKQSLQHFTSVSQAKFSFFNRAQNSKFESINDSSFETDIENLPNAIPVL